MRTTTPRLLTLTGTLLIGLVATVTGPLGSAQAVAPRTVAPAVTCAPDPFEVDDTGQSAAPLAVGSTVDRAICQGRDPLPGKPFVRDQDWFEFTATEGQAYTAQAVDLGSAMVNDAFDRGGFTMGITRIEADGSHSSIGQIISPNQDLVVTGPLTAGRYRILVANTDTEVYPDNVLATKTVEGDAGRCGVQLTASAAAPVLSGVTVAPTRVNGGDPATATLTFSAPAPANGMYINLSSSNAFVANANGSFQVPAGATRFTVPIRTSRPSADTAITFTGTINNNGPARTALLTVRR